MSPTSPPRARARRVSDVARAFPRRPSTPGSKASRAGLRAAQQAFGIVLAGGDTDRRPGPLSITITAFGSVRPGAWCAARRRSAGDRSSSPARSAMRRSGLSLRSDPSWRAAWGLDAGGAARLSRDTFRPAAAARLAAALRACASAAMDISDGLAKDLDRLAARAASAGVIEARDLPLSRRARRGRGGRRERSSI